MQLVAMIGLVGLVHLLVLGCVVFAACNHMDKRTESQNKPVLVTSPGAMPGETLQQLSPAVVPATPVGSPAGSEDVPSIVRESTMMLEGEYLHPDTDLEPAKPIEHTVSISNDIGLDSVVSSFDDLSSLLEEGMQMDLPLEHATT